MDFPATLARELARLSDHLTAAVALDAESAAAAVAVAHAADLGRLTAQVATLTAEVATLKGQLAESDAARDRLHARADELAADNRTLALELADHVAEREASEATAAALRDERERTAALQRERDAMGDALARDREALAGARDAQATQAAALAASRTAAQEAVAARERESALRQDAERQIAPLRDGLAAARAALADAEAARDAEMAARTAQVQELTDLRRQAGSTRSALREELVDRLSAVFDDIARGATIDEVLGASANGLADEFARVTVLAVNAGRLEPRYQRGFEPAGDIERLAAALDEDSFLAKAARSGDLGVHTGDSLMDLPFGGAPSLAVTAPIDVRGELLALIYADNDGRARGTDATPLRLADIIRRHASLRLDRLTQELKTIGELRAYARMLLDEVEYVYRADVSARKPDAERLERLTENLRCARQIYQQRLAIEGPTLPSLLEEVLATAIATKSATPFGRELAAVAPHAHPQEAAVAG